MKFVESFSSRRNLWLFAIIFIEGYVVLATELLAIRLLIPFAGSGTETISIIISSVLLPLAIGYHSGSNALHREYKRTLNSRRKFKGLRDVLVRNVLTVLFISSFGLSYFIIDLFFDILAVYHITSPLAKVSIYCAIFLVYPVYLLGQTIPIVSNYFSKSRLSEATGTMLFFSTLGSFLGSVFSTLVLMMVIGVNNTVLVTLSMLFLMIVLVKQKLLSFEVIFALLILLFAFKLNANDLFLQQKIYSNNAYNTIAINEKKDGVRTFMTNKSLSSQVGEKDSDRFPYIAYIEDNFIYTYHGQQPLRVLVIGAGGFTLGLKDKTNIYTFVDIDPDIKKVSEKYFLKNELGANKKFVHSSARAFLEENREKYDLIIIDAYTNFFTIPAECMSAEFFRRIKEKLNNDGIVIANFISSPDFRDKFSIRLYETFASVFPKFNKQVIGKLSPWPTNPKGVPANNLYIYINRENINDKTVYHDDLNTYSLDKY